MSKTKKSSKKSKTGEIVLADKDNQERNIDNFISKLSTSSEAAVGVTCCKTKEPFKLIKELTLHAHANSHAVSVWNPIKGWQNVDPTNGEFSGTPVPNTIDPVRAFEHMDKEDLNQVNSNNPTDVAGKFYIMFWGHFYIKVPLMIYYLAYFADKFSANSKRLVIVMPDSVELPKEVEDMIQIMELSLPNKLELREALDTVLKSLEEMENEDGEPADCRPDFSNEQIDTILNCLTGMTILEAETNLSKAFITHLADLPDELDFDAFTKMLLEIKSEVINKNDSLELMHKKDMSEVGGLNELKKWIRKRKSTFSKEAINFGVTPPKGILLVGPPGTGKSLASKAIASELNLPLVNFNISMVFNKYIGSSEQKVNDALKKIEAVSPCVAVIDEVDKAFSNDNGGSTDGGTTSRVFRTILSTMQDSKANIFWIFTANRADNLPAELCRGGRLSGIFSVTTPNEVERAEILKIHLKKCKQDPELKDLDKAVEASEGFVSAELEEAVKSAVVEAWNEGNPKDFTVDLIVNEFKNTVPISKAFKDDFEKMEQWASANAKPASTPLEIDSETVSKGRKRNRKLGKKKSNISSIDLDD